MEDIKLTELQKKKYTRLFEEKKRVQGDINELTCFIVDSKGVELKDQVFNVDLDKGIITVKEVK
jgi:hypothetical protein